MKFMIAAHADVGIKKNTNQDSYMIKVAQTKKGRVCLCVICDGMGGLAKGELASAAMIRSFEKWFEHELPKMIMKEWDPEVLKEEWYKLIRKENMEIREYANKWGCRMGTTAVACLFIQGKYYLVNVGDSRAYAVLDKVYRLTKDQSLAQYEIDQGRWPADQAEAHPQRNVLLQCIGASESVFPDFYQGNIVPGTVFLLCSDGFRHEVTEEEIYEKLNNQVLEDEKKMKEQIVWLTELVKDREELDNISAIAIKICQGE